MAQLRGQGHRGHSAGCSAARPARDQATAQRRLCAPHRVTRAAATSPPRIVRRTAFSQSVPPSRRRALSCAARAFGTQPGVSRATRHRRAPCATAGAAPVFRFRLASDRPTLQRFATMLRVEHQRGGEARCSFFEFQADSFFQFTVMPRASAPRDYAAGLPARSAGRLGFPQATPGRLRLPGYKADRPSRFRGRLSESISGPTFRPSKSPRKARAPKPPSSLRDAQARSIDQS